MTIYSLSLIRLLLSFSTTAKAQWRPDLPWSDLSAAIAGDLIDTTPSNYLEECAPEFEKLPGVIGDPTSTFDRSNHGLVDQPSGLCLPHFFCSFEECAPFDPANPGPFTVYDTIINGFSVPAETPYSQMNATILSWMEDTSNPYYNLPSKVLFPTRAQDVVAAVKFAKEHGLELSVKNSGHSYTSASSKRDTLLLNMARYTTYAAEEGVTDCSALDTIGTGDDPSLNEQPCRLSLAKGKDAVIRVGGGENWGEVYAAVRMANEEQPDGYKYHVVGGAAATVSPMGWTFSGGLAGTVAGRIFGFGLDQVLQLEMVLPNGQHVKFGPTEWEVVAGYDVPKTLKVSGVCNTAADSTEPVWAACPQDLAINFDDLWLAVRGGGGGTWGVVLSIYLQLHEYLPYETIYFKPWGCTTMDTLTDEQKAIGNGFASTFQIKFLLDPTSVGMSDAESNSCGAPDSGGGIYHCYGEGTASAMDTAWKDYLTQSRSTLESLGIPADFIDTALSCNIQYVEGNSLFQDTAYILSPNATIVSYKDYLQYLTYPQGFTYEGLGYDSPLPAYAVSNALAANILIPAKWILENIETAVVIAPPDSGYKAFGGKASIASDQMDSLSSAHRSAGYMAGAFFEDVYNDVFFSTFFPQMYDTTDKSNFPAFLGGNHAGINTRGPLKSDWTKACPVSWTKEERDEKCISLQECIWGTNLLKKLETIKETLDPDYIFDCNGCVGNNRDKSGNVNATSAPVTGAPMASGLISGSPMMSSAPATPAPITDTPSSSFPITSAPESSAPVTSALVTDAPSSSAPFTSAPESSAPVTLAPITSEPTSSPSLETSASANVLNKKLILYLSSLSALVICGYYGC